MLRLFYLCGTVKVCLLLENVYIHVHDHPRGVKRLIIEVSRSEMRNFVMSGPWVALVLVLRPPARVKTEQ